MDLKNIKEYIDSLESIKLVLSKSHKNTTPEYGYGTFVNTEKIQKRKYHIWFCVFVGGERKFAVERLANDNGHVFCEYYCICSNEHLRARMDKDNNISLYMVDYDTEEEVEVNTDKSCMACHSSKQIEVNMDSKTGEFYTLDKFQCLAHNERMDIQFPLSEQNGICSNCMIRLKSFFDDLDFSLKQVYDEVKNEMRETIKAQQQQIEEFMVEYRILDAKSEKTIRRLQEVNEELQKQNKRLKKKISNMTTKQGKEIGGKKIEM